MNKSVLLVAIAVFATAPASALTYITGNQPAAENSFGQRFATSGVKGDFRWTAMNTIIGQTATSNALPPDNAIGGGDALYRPTADKNGTVALLMDYGAGGRFVCSGSVIGNGMSIATAAHCVSDGFGTPGPLTTTAYFFKGDPDERTPLQTGGTAIRVSRTIVNPGYTGEVIDQNDIAILRLETAAPSWAPRYDLHTPTSLTGVQFNVAGYGRRSAVGGAVGTAGGAGAQTGYLREGDNIYDYAFGDAVFDGFWTDIIGGENFFGTARIDKSYVSDFDRFNAVTGMGVAAQSQSYRLCAVISGPAACAPFINNGVGAREVGISGGDSGGPGFVNGKLASINSYGLSFGVGFGDVLTGLNSSWGELGGYVPVYIHTDFINAAMAVPEPSTWAMLIAGFGLTGAAMRRQRRVTATRASFQLRRVRAMKALARPNRSPASRGGSLRHAESVMD